MSQKVLLMILDGWGNGDGSKADIISRVDTPNIDKLKDMYPTSHLLTSGEDVGLPQGQMGNSEVGHLNIGAGRIVYQDLVKINKAIESGEFKTNGALKEAFQYAADNNKQVHLMGLLSDGGVHSHINHLFALCDMAGDFGLKDVFIHGFGDGRDTDPHSGKGYVTDLLNYLENSTGQLVSFVGRYYAMDRDKRWERTKEAYDLLLHGKGNGTDDILNAIDESYSEGVSDEFVKPVVLTDKAGEPVGRIKENDVVIFFNFRNDRARQLTFALTQSDLVDEGMKTIPLYFCSMTPYDATYKGLHILYPKENVYNTIGEVLAGKGLSQLRIAETEKYAHVTFFFSGGREETFENESRKLVPSPRVTTYDLQPEMSAYKVKDEVIRAMSETGYDFICLNFANGDMVGHTGVYDAISKAVKAVDACVGEVIETARESGYEVLIIADHGNADHALNSDGSPNTAHSLNPVPAILVSDRYDSIKKGILADVAPTILSLMGIIPPEEMTGHSLIRKKHALD